MKKIIKFVFLAFFLFIVLNYLDLMPKSFSKRLTNLDEKMGDFLGEEKKDLQEKSLTSEESTLIKKNANDLSREEKEKIDLWLADNKYNRYGDSLDYVYSGGTPLFNEESGERIDRYDYIMFRHPDILQKIKNISDL